VQGNYDEGDLKMVQTLKRPLLALAVAGVVAAVAGSAALAAPGHGPFASRVSAFRAGFGGGGFGGFGQFAGGFGGPGFGVFVAPALGGPGGPGIGFRVGPGGSGVLAADVLTPAAAYLGISPLSTLTSDLNGGKTLAQEATAKGKTASGLVDAIVAAQKTVLDNEKAAGWITDAQETALLGVFTDQVTNLVNNGPPVPPAAKTATGPLQTAATYLGISVSQLQSDLQSGKSLADDATANGKTVDGLVTALVAPAKTKLDALVAANTITAAQESAILANLTQRVTDFVNNAKLGMHAAVTRLQSLLRR
jgi:hypothetical protein